MSNIIHKTNWMGGRFYLDGKPFDFRDKPPGWITIDGEHVFRIEYEVVKGSDYDMGSAQDWTRTDPGIFDGDIKPRFLSVIELADRDVCIELDNHDH